MPMDDIFISNILEITNEFLCVDIGYTLESGWVIIEINPPYSLELYEIFF